MNKYPSLDHIISAEFMYRVREIGDSDVTEHKDDGTWGRAARLFGLDQSKTALQAKVRAPMMKEDVYHRQWNSAFVALLFQQGVDGQVGGILGEDKA